MLILFLTVMGVFSFAQLGVDLFPRSDPATVFVRVQLPGASPEEVTSQVVMPLEEAIASVRVDGRQVAQIAHFSDTPADAMTSVLAAAIAAIAKEEERRG